MVASIRATATYRGSSGTSTFTVPIPEGTVAGDLILFPFLAGASTAATTDSAAKGWWRYGATSVNTRSWAIYARIYNPSDPASVYTLTLGSQAAPVIIVHAIMGHAVAAEGDLQIGPNWLRGDNGGSSGRVVAPSITTPGADRLVLAFTGEASNALGSYSVTTQNSFTKVTEYTEGPTSGQAIEWVTSWQKTLSAAGASGDLEINYASSPSLNGVGAQVSIPSSTGGGGGTPKAPAVAKFGTLLSGAGVPQSGTLTVIPEGTTVAGDLVVVVCSVADTASGSYSISGGGGSWTTVLASASLGTGKLFVFSKPYVAGDTTYTLTRSGSDAYRIVPVTIHGWDGSSPIVGALGTRAASGGAFATTAPSISTAVANTLALYIAMERTSANDNVPTVDNGFTTAYDAHTVSGDYLQAVYVASKVIASPGAVGATTATFTNSHASNSGAILMGFAPSGDVSTPTPATGCIGSRVPTSVSHNSITMGVDRLQGTVVKVAAKLGATEVARQTVTIDPDSGWGSTTFTGLQPNSHYGFAFYVDDVLQTDTEALIQTHPTPGTPTSFKFITGSCQFTGSNHPVWDRIREENARQIGHMGDLHYGDATTLSAWRSAVESSFTAPRFRAMLGLLPMTWTWDNHDRIITNPTGTGTGLNLGETDPATNTEWRKLAGSAGWSSSDTAGRTWVIGRVRFIQTDQWTVRDDGDGDPAPRTFLGPTQKQWFKDTLDAATEPFVVWLCQWTGQNHANGRWNSFPEETTELENFINARPDLKSRMVMIGGDSHSLQVTDGSRTAAQGQRFPGIPNYNISGFNRSSDAGQGGAGWLYDVPLRTSAQPEADWGGYSRMTFTDDGTSLTLLWEGVRVDKDGVTDVMASQTLVQEPDEVPATLSGEGWLSAEVTPVPATDTAIYGEGEFEATVDVTVVADAPHSGSGALAAATEAVVEAPASFSGSGTLTAVLAFEEIAIITAPFTGSGSVSVAAEGVIVGETDAVFSGSGSLEATTDAEVIASVSPTFTGTGSLTTDVTPALNVEVVANFTGDSALSADTATELAAEIQALFAGSGSLTAGVVTDQSADVSIPFSGSGELTMLTEVELVATVEASFGGPGGLTLSAATEQVLEALFSGTGSNSTVVAADDVAVVQATFSGSGSLTGQAEIHVEIPADFSGSGAFSAVAWALTPDGSQVYLSGKLVVLSLGGQTITISR